MAKLTLTQVLEITEASQGNIVHWMMRLPLNTKYEKTVQGRTRGFSRENTLELALLHRLIEGGMKPSAAAECLSKLFSAIKAKKPHGWAIFLSSGHYFVTDDLPAERLAALSGSAIVLNVAKVEAEVDAFLAKLEEDDDD